MRQQFFECCAPRRQSFLLALAMSFAMLLVFATSGCVSDPKRSLKGQLDDAGFDLWYPPESGVEPGQIWFVDGARRHRVFERPPEIKVTRSSTRIADELRVREITARLAADPRGLIAELAGVGVSLDLSRLDSVQLEVGDAEILRLNSSDLNPDSLARSGRGDYAKALQRVRSKEPGWILVGSVLESTSFKYVVTASSRDNLSAEFERARMSKLGGVEVTRSSEHAFNISYSSPSPLVSGVNFVAGALIGGAPSAVNDRLAVLESSLTDASPHASSIMTALLQRGLFDTGWSDLVVEDGHGRAIRIGPTVRRRNTWFVVEARDSYDVFGPWNRDAAATDATERVTTLWDALVALDAPGHTRIIFVTIMDNPYRSRSFEWAVPDQWGGSLNWFQLFYYPDERRLVGDESFSDWVRRPG